MGTSDVFLFVVLQIVSARQAGSQDALDLPLSIPVAEL